jgi:hypothetical protein
VKLTLNQAPNHTNGKWQDGRVIWDASLDASRPLPALCYASWSQPDRQFQETHFGRVLLDGDELMQYCLWENGLSTDQAREWKTFLSGLQRDPELKKKLEAFRLVADGSLTLAKENQNQPVVGCQLLLNALGKEPASK